MKTSAPPGRTTKSAMRGEKQHDLDELGRSEHIPRKIKFARQTVNENNNVGMVLGIICTSGIGALLMFHGLFRQIHADNIQAYINCCDGVAVASVQQIGRGMEALAPWLASNRLLLKSTETEFIWLESRSQLSGFDRGLAVEAFRQFSFSNSMRNFGVNLISLYAPDSAYMRDVLHWLRVPERISYRLAALVWQCILGNVLLTCVIFAVKFLKLCAVEPPVPRPRVTFLSPVHVLRLDNAETSRWWVHPLGTDLRSNFDYSHNDGGWAGSTSE